jgi:hypothetical protein
MKAGSAQSVKVVKTKGDTYGILFTCTHVQVVGTMNDSKKQFSNRPCCLKCQNEERLMKLKEKKNIIKGINKKVSHRKKILGRLEEAVSREKKIIGRLNNKVSHEKNRRYKM